jgi:hypothetical protein
MGQILITFNILYCFVVFVFLGEQSIMTDAPENWRQFQGTELGGLMNRLYGGDKPQINYPKPKQKKFQPAGGFIGLGAKAGADDVRKHTIIKAPLVDVPVVGTGSGRRKKFAAVDFIPKKRGESDSRKEIEDIKMRDNYYRPAAGPAYSSEAEKEKLSQINQYKGGKGLPLELTQAAGEAPFEAIQRKKEKERIQSVRNAKLMASGKYIEPHRPAQISVDEELMEQISSEIEERNEYLQELMDNSGGPVSAQTKTIIARVKGEISERVKQLRNLERR